MATVTAQLGEGTVVDIQARQFSWLVLWVVIAVAYSPQRTIRLSCHPVKKGFARSAVRCTRRLPTACTWLILLLSSRI